MFVNWHIKDRLLNYSIETETKVNAQKKRGPGSIVRKKLI